MAAGDSAVSVCNIGLIGLGEEPITAFTDQSKAARFCKARYDQLRRAMLRSCPWGCATRQAGLAASATAPMFTYAAFYPVPTDFIRLNDLPENRDAIWELMNIATVGQAIATDEGAPLDILYNFDLTDPTQFDPLLSEAIGYAVGAALAIPLGRDKALKQIMEGEREGRLSSARLVSAQENSRREWDTDTWLRQRRG